MNEELVAIAMEIILHAGDARKLISDAGNQVAKFNPVEAENKLKEAHLSILKAHKAQTNMIQREAEGEPVQASVLFNHAQDTLMVTTSEYNSTKQLNNLAKALIEKLGIEGEEK